MTQASDIDRGSAQAARAVPASRCRYFVEIVSLRDDDRYAPLGAGLYATPTRDGRRNPGREMVRHVRPDDVVLHIRTTGGARIVGVSRVDSPARSVKNEKGWFAPLKQFEILAPELSRDVFLLASEVVQVLRANLEHVEDEYRPLFFGQEPEPASRRKLESCASRRCCCMERGIQESQWRSGLAAHRCNRDATAIDRERRT